MREWIRSGRGKGKEREKEREGENCEGKEMREGGKGKITVMCSYSLSWGKMEKNRCRQITKMMNYEWKMNYEKAYISK